MELRNLVRLCITVVNCAKFCGIVYDPMCSHILPVTSKCPTLVWLPPHNCKLGAELFIKPTVPAIQMAYEVPKNANKKQI